MTYEELRQRQSWTLEQKVDHAVIVVSSFMERVNGNNIFNIIFRFSLTFFCLLKIFFSFAYRKSSKRSD
jgi:hypothetical protein